VWPVSSLANRRFMQLLLILAVLAALTIAEGCPQQPVPAATLRLGLAAGAVAAVALLARVASGVIARRLLADFDRRHVLLRRFGQLRRAYAVLWLGAAGGILYGLGWAQMVRFNWHLDRAVLIDDLLILAPVLLPPVLGWAAFFEVERALQIRLAPADRPEARLPTRGEYVLLHVRHYLGVLLVPVLALLAVQDTFELIAPSLAHGPGAALIHLVPLVGLFVLFPVLLRHVWDTRPLEPGPLRDRLEAVSRRSGFRARQILVWHTGGMLVNAAVTGFVPFFRYVFLSDGLLGRLSEEEIEAVFGHELGHVRHRHLLLRIAAMLVPLSLWLLLAEGLPQTATQLQDWIAATGPVLKVPIGLAALAALGLYMTLVFGFYSRLLEFQADLFACGALGPPAQGEAPVATFISALEKLAAANGTDRNARSWQHASVARRVGFLVRVAGDPAFRRRFQRQVRLLAGLIVATVLSPLVFQLLLG